MGRFFFKDVFKCFTKIYAQSDLDASRLRAAMEKTDADKVSVVGSFKFDVACRNSEKERQMREWVGDGLVLLGGSTWPGEDEVLLRIYSRLRGKVKLVIAPRHFEKADSIEENIKRYGFTCRRRSRGDEDGEVLLADTTGELMGLYGIANVVFVGKSLCAHGSQNMIEPCLCGKVVFVGPYTENFRPVMSDLLASNAIVQVPDAAALEAQIISAFGDDPEGTFKSLALRAEQAVLNRRGVVPKCVDDIRWSLR
jgi:3-deoxy-D-manno-octulosonic-acid transferase